MEQIEGIVEQIIYCNENNGYTVCDIRAGRRLITLVGYIPGLGIGETIFVSGTWVVHQDYGKQLKVESYERRLPKTTDAIFKYLASGVIKGIGEATAKKIVDKFGDETIHVLQFEPLKLSGIKGISTGKALRIGQAFMEQEQVRQVVMFLQSYGISANYAVKVWKKFGEQSIEEIKRNPYRLTDDDINIGFRIADRVAISIGIDLCSKFRIQSGVQYALSAAVQKGHVYLPAFFKRTARCNNVIDQKHTPSLNQIRFFYVERAFRILISFIFCKRALRRSIFSFYQCSNAHGNVQFFRQTARDKLRLVITPFPPPF